MKKSVGLWVLYLGTTLCAFSQVDTSFIYNTSPPYGGVLDLRLAKSPTRYYYLQGGITFSYRESSPGVRTNAYTSMITWNTSAYEQGNMREKNGTSDIFVMNYRMLKPKNYDSSYSPGYPIIIMIHGAGESGNCWVDKKCYWSTASYNPNTNSPPAPTDEFHKLLNNDRNLLHGGGQHLTAVNLAGSRLPNDPTLPERAFPGFVLFPQSLNGWTNHLTVEDGIKLLRLIIKKYNIDENRVYIHGLSNGGIGVYQALKRAPWLFTAALPMSAIYDAGIITGGMVGEVSKIPLWIFQGGQDLEPTPQRTYGYVRQFRNAGAEVRYYLYPNLGHGTWNTAYKEPDFFSWMLGKRKNNPHIAYGNPIICNTTQTGVALAFAKGFLAYQWQRDGQIIPGATSAEYIANTPGTYRGRFSRKANPTEADWEPWSDPIVVSEMNPEKPSIEVLGTAHLRGPGLASTDENNTVKLKAADSAELYMWYRNGSPVDFPGTGVDDTLRVATFTNGSTSGNGGYTLVAQSFNCPSPPSDPVNIFFNNSSPQNISIAADAINFKGIATSSSIFLSWNDVSGLERGYELWRRKAGATDFKFVTKTDEDGISYEDKQLDPGTTYEYKLRAVSNSGSSNYVPSADLSVNYQFTTLGDFRTPHPPQDLKALSNTLNTIKLSWKPSRDDNNIKEYYVYYNNDSVSTASNSTTFTLTGLPLNTVYSIRVKAVDFGNHFSQPSNQIIATTYMTGLVYKHSTGAWESLDDSSMVATWTNPEFTGTVTNFTLQPRTQDDFFNFQFIGYLHIETEGTYYFRITSNDGSRLILDGTVLADNDGIHDTKTVTSEAVYLTAGPHHIEVQYFDDVGGHTLKVRYKGPGIGDEYINIPDAALRSGTYIPASPPDKPDALSATAAGMQRIDLTWEFKDDDQTDYEVYRSTSSSGPFEIVARSKGLSAVDSIGLLPGTAYYYKVKTVNNSGSSGFSSAATATTSADTSPPTVPQQLTLINKTLTNLAFSWEPSTDNVGVTQYEIYSGSELIGASTMQAFTVEGLSPNTQYVITVKAVDASGNRSESSAQLVVVTNTSAIFYSLATGNLNELSTWRLNANGTGEAPQNFSDNGQYFMVANRTTASLSGPWTVGGSSSRVIVPDGVTLTADHPFSGNVELQENAVLNLNNATAPNLVKLSGTSTVNFNAYPTIMANTYGNIILSGTVQKTFTGDTITVRGNLTVDQGLALKGAPHNSTHIRVAGMVTLHGTRPATAADNTVDLAFTGTTAQSLVTGGDVYLYRISTTPNQTVSVVNPSGAAVKINLGSLKGGGLLLSNGSELDVKEHDLVLVDAAVVNPAQQTGSVSINGGDLLINSSSSQHSYLYWSSTQYKANRLEVDLKGAGNVTVRSPLQIVDGIKVKNGTLASESNIILLAIPDRTAVIYEIANTGKITGDVTVQQHLPAKGNVFRYLSAPVSGVTVSEWQESFPINGSFSGASGGGAPSMFVYRQASGGWVAYPPPGGSNTAPIERGVGYSAFLTNTSPITLRVNGTPFQGSIPFALSPGTEGVANNGWNLTGNPYASPIVWGREEGAWTRSGVSNVIAIRNNFTVNGQVRSQVVYHDVTLSEGVIPAGQAFWVRTFTASPSLAVQEEAKVNPEEESNTDLSPLPHLIVNLKQGQVSDPAYIVFNPEGTDGFDAQYEGRKLRNYGMFNLSTLTADTVLLAINHVGDEFCTKTIRFNVGNVPPGSYSFSFSNLQSLTDIGKIVLTDHYAGSSTPVTGSDYSFSVTENAASFGRARFEITFIKAQVDVSGPKIATAEVCAPAPGSVTISNSQVGVFYQAINEEGQTISDPVAGSGQTISLQIPAAELTFGTNKLRITAGFSGCERQTLPGEVTINYVSELTVITEGDVSVCEGADVTLEASGAPAGGFYKWFDSNGTHVEGATSAIFEVTGIFTETVYYVATAHPSGCESEMAEIHIYADTLDMPVIQINEDTLFTEVVGYYQWKKDEEEIPGATLHYYVPQENGSYSVVASNGGCYKESEPYQFVLTDGGDGDGDGNGNGNGDGNGGDGDGGDPVTGIENGNNSEFVLNIYPVPSNGHSINVLLRTPKTDPVLIEIIDALGRLHFSKIIDAGQLMNGTSLVPGSPLYSGIYFIRATQADIKAGKKLIVKD